MPEDEPGLVRSGRGQGWSDATGHLQGSCPGDSYPRRGAEVRSRDRAGLETGTSATWLGAVDWAEVGLLGPCSGWGKDGQGQRSHWARSSTELVRKLNMEDAGTNTCFELRLEAGVAGPTPLPAGNWNRSRCGLLGLLPVALTSTSTALSSIIPIADGRLLLFSPRGQGAVEIYRGCCRWSSLPQTARERQWGPELSWEPGRGGTPSLHRLWERFRFSAVLQAIRKGTGNYAVPSKCISEYNICFVQVSLVY